ncbi:hypothetical protein L596_005959 [Steinernema carpocapsae]|uniref:Uncharacterized protein n=1 Tax=Steinernema carpocapsae TaxID=34508 RepID=A0A4U8V0N1_STECR|nr:hypothetical protein L596_005959 [Steinernema carpocapsae]
MLSLFQTKEQPAAYIRLHDKEGVHVLLTAIKKHTCLRFISSLDGRRRIIPSRDCETEAAWNEVYVELVGNINYNCEKTIKTQF